MNDHFENTILESTGATSLHKQEMIQNLWSGYGHIWRYALEGCELESVVVKHVRLPKGRDKDLSHQRKLKSYRVETAWYNQWSDHCNENCRIPKCLALNGQDDEVLMVLEDLDSAGYPRRMHGISLAEVKVGLSWLANFHAVFMGESPENLWEEGTYWHLATRPDELRAMGNTALRNTADKIDFKLKNSPFQTFVHGDAKLANFCFSKDRTKVAAVDFQYVGGGCGMKDVAYFISSCFYEDECERLETQLLDYYFKTLREALTALNKDINLDALEKDWRNLYSLAWTDFHRFIMGWSPGYARGNSYSNRLAQKVIAELSEPRTNN